MTPTAPTAYWHVYPLGATGAPMYDRPADDAGHRLRDLIPWVDYAADLGFSGLLLAPIFESVAHGYDTLNHLVIDSRLGDEDDFAALAKACRSRDMELVLDGVFNHVAVDHPVVGDGGPIKRNAEGYVMGWEGDTALAELDHSDPRTADYVVQVMEHWLQRGATGWRLDVAYAVPTNFWAEVIDRVKQTYPDAFFLGEMIHGDYAEFAQASHLDSVTQYELWKAIWSSIENVNFWELAHAVERHQDFNSAVLMNTFIGNHDVDRITEKVGWAGAGVAAVLLFSLPGLPSVYYGDEFGVAGAKGQGERADVPLRPHLPEVLPPRNDLTNLYAHLLWLRGQHPWIAQGELEVVDKTNETITIEVDGRLRVEATTTTARVLIDGEEAVNWSA